MDRRTGARSCARDRAAPLQGGAPAVLSLRLGRAPHRGAALRIPQLRARVNASVRGRAPWIALAVLTAIQMGIGAWRAAVMFREGVAAGIRPLVWSTGLASELQMCVLLALAAYWWLPAGENAPRRTLPAWCVRFLLLSWVLALAHYAWAFATGRLHHGVTWLVLAMLFALGAWVRQLPVEGNPPATPSSPQPRRLSPVVWLALAFFVAGIPHLVFPYHFTDAQDIWACRAAKFVARGGLTGIFDCIDPARPPLHSLVLWLGIDDPTFEGRLLPLLLFGAFTVVFYRLAQRVAPRLAPWAVVWLLATDHVFKGQVSAYAGVPLMLAAGVAIAVAVDDGTLALPPALAVVVGSVAGAAVALIRRDGMPEFVVAMGVLVRLSTNRRDPRLWAPLAGAVIGYFSWTLRPAELHSAALFAPVAPSHWTLITAAQAMARLLYGVQGQVLSHYGYGAFAWSWIIATIWVARGGAAGSDPATRDLARRFGWIGLTA